MVLFDLDANIKDIGIKLLSSSLSSWGQVYMMVGHIFIDPLIVFNEQPSLVYIYPHTPFQPHSHLSTHSQSIFQVGVTIYWEYIFYFNQNMLQSHYLQCFRCRTFGLALTTLWTKWSPSRTSWMTSHFHTSCMKKFHFSLIVHI